MSMVGLVLGSIALQTISKTPLAKAPGTGTSPSCGSSLTSGASRTRSTGVFWGARRKERVRQCSRDADFGFAAIELQK
eukprot:CAMPEP_0197914632 /NCGR_PEP_ID=MMETSP1439-20131203/78838_1 /TAXON_ID=66791 /ORGANISM="Gonyaulax spinifera, Strain CCMP409" /LENGTH=77 /DNA_ID=CAMNT_0043536551 /DNA_START=33 /DNA_END=263 /DNA_ORIENTATION=-